MAYKKIQIVLALDGQDEFKQGMSNATKEAQNLQSQLGKLSSEYDGSANSLEYLTKKQEILTQQEEQYKKKLETSQQALAQAQSTQKKAAERYEELAKEVEEAKEALQKMADAGEEGTKEYQKQAKEVEALEKALNKQGTQCSKCEGAISDYSKKVNNAQTDINKVNSELKENETYLNEAKSATDGCATSIDKFGNKAEEAGKDVSSMGDKLKTAIVNKAVSVGIDALNAGLDSLQEAAQAVVEVGSDFEAAMSEVEAISGATGDDLEDLTEKAKELGESTKYSATEVANAFQYMSLAGWDTQEMLSGIDGVLSLAAATGMELADASDMVTDYLSAFSMEASDASYFVDLLAYAQSNSNTTAEQLGEAYKNCAANLNAAGQDVETTTSLLEAMANQGYKGSEAGTALAAIMRDITASMEDGAIQIGETTVAVADADGNYRDLTDILQDVEDATEGMGDAEKAAALSTVFTSDSTKGLNLILNEGVDNIESYEEALRNCDGAAEAMANTMQDNLQGDLTTLDSALQGLGIAAYEYVNGPLRSVVQGVTDIIGGITDAITPQKTELEELVEDAKEATDNVYATLDAADQTVVDAETTAAEIQILGNQLISLNEVEDKSLAQKQTLSSLVDTLGETIPELAEAYNEETGEIELSSEAIRELIDNTTELMLVQAMEAAAQEELNAYAEAVVALEKAKTAQQSYEDELEFWSEFQEKVTALNDSYEVYISTLNSGQDTTAILEQRSEELAEAQDLLQQAFESGAISAETYEKMLAELSDMDATSDVAGNGLVAETAANIAECAHSVDEAAKATDEAAEAAEEANKAYEETNEAIKNATEATEGNTEALDEEAVAQERANERNRKAGQIAEEVLDNTEALAESNSDLADSADEASESVEDLADAEEEAAEAAQKAAEVQQDAFDTIYDAYTSTMESIASDLKNSINLSEKFDGGDENTTETINENLESYVEGLKTYQENLEKVRQMTDETGEALFSADVLAEIESNGTDMANMLQEIVDTYENEGEYGVEQIKSINDQWQEALDLSEEIASVSAANQTAYELAMGELGSSDVDFSRLRESIDAAVESAADGWSGLTEETEAALNSAIITAQTMGVQIPEGLADSISSGEVTAEQAVQQMNAAIQGTLEGLLLVAQSSGAEVSDELATSISNGTADAESAMTELMNAISNTAEGDGSVASAVESEVSDAVDAIDNSTEDLEAGGSEITDSIAAGVTENEEALTEAVTEVVTAGAEAVKSDDNKTAYQEAGGTLVDAIAAGIVNSQSAVEEVATDTAGKAAAALEAEIAQFQDAGETAAMAYADAIAAQNEYATTQANVLLKAVTDVLNDANTSFEAYANEAAGAYSDALASEGNTTYAGTGAQTLVKGATDALNNALTSFESYGNEAAAAYAGAIGSEDNAANAGTSAETLLNGAMDALNNALSSFEDYGNKAAMAYADAITAQDEYATTQANVLLKAVTDALNGANTSFEAYANEAAGAYSDALGSEDNVTIVGTGTQTLIKGATDELNSALTSFESYGNEAGVAYADAIGAQTKTASSKAKALAQAALSAAQSYKASFQTAGYNMSLGLAAGITSGQSTVIQAAKTTAALALAAAKDELGIHSPSAVFREEVGQQIGKGMAFGIDDSASLASDAADEMSQLVYTKATAWLSEYKAAHTTTLEDEAYFWQEVTKHCEDGTAAYEKALTNYTDALAKSIKNSVSTTTTSGSGSNLKTVAKDTETYYSDVYDAAADYMDKLETVSEVSLQEQLSYWESVQSLLQSGTDAWYDAQKEINSITDSLYSTIVSNAEKNLSNYQVLNDMTIKEEIAYWKEVRKQIVEQGGKYTDEWYEVTQTIKDLREDYYASIVSDAEDALEKQKILGDVSVDDELKYWKKILRQLENKGQEYSDEWYEVYEKIQDLRDSYYDEMYSAAEDYASKMDTLEEWSLTEELAYWEAVQDELKEGTDAWYNAQSKINSIKSSIGTVSNMSSLLSAYETYYDLSEKAEMQYWDAVRQQYEEGTDDRLEADQEYFDAKEKYYDKLTELEEDYADGVKEIEENLAEEIQSLNDEYQSELESRVDSYANAFGLFDEFYSESEDGKTLLYNLETQAAGYEAWVDALDALDSRNILSDELMDELTEMGPEYLASIYALYDLTDEELTAYNEAYQRKMDAATEQATKDTEDLKAQVEEQTAALIAQAEQDKEELKAEYDAAVESVNTNISDELLLLANNVETIAEDQTSALVSAISGGVSSIVSALGSYSASASTAASYGTTVAQSGTDTVLSIITSGTAKTSQSAAAEASHTDLYNYILDNYGYATTTAQMKSIGEALGVDTSSGTNSEIKAEILEKLKAAGYASGGRNLKDELIWMDEELESLGPELVVSRSDNALLTRIPAGSDVIDADTTSNLIRLSEINPDDLFSVLEQQQETMLSYLDSLNTVGNAQMNDLLMSGNTGSQTTMNTSVMESMLSSMTEIMAEYLPHLMDRQDVYINGDTLIGEISSGVGTQLTKESRRAR